MPPYSIVRWNLAKGLPVTEKSGSDDLALFKSVCYINEFVDYINDRHMVSSVRFKLDLIQEKKEHNKEGRKSVTYRQFFDGIHPNELLAIFFFRFG